MNSAFEARTIFRKLGAGEVNAQLATQWAHHKPITSEPSAIPSESVVRLIQRGLMSVGCAVKPSGRMDALTAQCLADVSGPNWKNMTWLQHGKNIVKMREMGQTVNSVPSLEGLGESGGGMGASLGVLLSVGALVYIMAKSK